MEVAYFLFSVILSVYISFIISCFDYVLILSAGGLQEHL